MEKLVSLCKRRGFVFPASEIYGGINGFWDWALRRTASKNNLRDRWWRDLVECPPIGSDGQPLDLVGFDSSIIQKSPRPGKPAVTSAASRTPWWTAASKRRYRADHLGLPPQRGRRPAPELRSSRATKRRSPRSSRSCAGGRSPTCSRPSHSSTLSSAPTLIVGPDASGARQPDRAASST